MSAERDITIDEKRVYGDQTGRTDVYVATGAGLARVAVSGDLVGEFGLARRGAARDVAARDGRVAVAAAEDVLVGDGDSFAETEFGPATAVGVDADGVVAAGEGRVARLVDGEWTTLCEVADVRAVDGDLLAAADGVFRLDGTHVGLADARDVATADGPLAATASGLYRLGNGWMAVLEGDVRLVAAAPDGRAHAATPRELYARRGDEWEQEALPVAEPVAGVGYAGATYAVTESGTFLAADAEGWTSRSLGLPDVRALAVA